MILVGLPSLFQSYVKETLSRSQGPTRRCRQRGCLPARQNYARVCVCVCVQAMVRELRVCDTLTEPTTL